MVLQVSAKTPAPQIQLSQISLWSNQTPCSMHTYNTALRYCNVTADLFHSDCDCLEGNDGISFTFVSAASTDDPSNTKLLQAAFCMQVVKGRGVPTSGLWFVTFSRWNWWNASLLGPPVFSQDKSSPWWVVCSCWRDTCEWDTAVSFKVVTAQSEINQDHRVLNAMLDVRLGQGRLHSVCE